VRFSKGQPLESTRVKEAIAEGEAKLNGAGRIVVRASGTEPLIRIMAEGDDERVVKQVVNSIASAVEEAATAG
jgi:phosphoglucosamine mutase